MKLKVAPNFRGEFVLLGKYSLRANWSVNLSEAEYNSNDVQAAVAMGWIVADHPVAVTPSPSPSPSPQPEAKQPEIKLPDPPPEPQTRMSAWDFNKQLLLDKSDSKRTALNPISTPTTVVDKGAIIQSAGVVDPKASDFNVQVGDIDFSDVRPLSPQPETSPEPNPPTTVKPSDEKTRKPIQKTATSGKKKTKPAIKPVGKVRPEKTAEDAFVDIPPPKPSEVIELITNEQMHLPDDEEVDFVDVRSRVRPRDIADQNGETE